MKRFSSRCAGLVGALALAWLSAAAAHSAESTSTAAAVGLLPIHAVTVDLDALGSKKKGDADGAASLEGLKKLWDGYLKSAGFNALAFTVDVRDLGPRGAGRVAQLCRWAKQNNVRIAPLLSGAAEGEALPADYGERAAAFVGKVLAELGPSAAESYSQIVLYQLERPLNHPASHGVLAADGAAQQLRAAAEAVRAAETAKLSALGLQATPLLVAASFDYELVKRGAIAHTPLTDETFEAAFAATSDYLATVLATAPVEVVAVEWYAGSVSAEAGSRMPDLLARLQAEAPGKLLVMNTGFSSAAGSDTAQARYFALTLNNLCDLRVRQGVDSPFAGIVWRDAVDGDGGAAKPLDVDAIAKLDWAARAKELDRAWTDPKADAKDARSWFASIQSNFGMISRAKSSGSSLAPKTAFLVMSHLESALAESPEAADAIAVVKEIAAAGKDGAGQQIKSRLQGALFGLLDAFLSKTAQNLFAEPSAPAPVTGPAPAARPDLQIMFAGTLPTSGTVQTAITVPVTVFNGGSAAASDAAVYLRSQSGDLAHSSPAPLLPGASMTVQLSWTPGKAEQLKGITVEAYCANDADLQTNRADLGDLSIASSGGGGPKPPRPLGDVLGDIRGQVLDPVRNVSTDGGAPDILVMGTYSTVDASSSATWNSSGVEGGTVMSAPAPGASGGGTAGGATAARPIGSPAPPPSSGEAASSVVRTAVSNPYSTPYRDAVATLRVDGRVVAQRPIGTLLPGQQRTVTFDGWRAPRAGGYQVTVELEGVGPEGRKLRSKASQPLTIGATAAAGPRSILPSPAGARPLTRTRGLGPIGNTASSQLLTSAGTRGLSGSRPGAVRSLASGAPLLGLSANAILVRPFPPAVDAAVEGVVQLTNLESAAAHATVELSVDGEALGSASVDVPPGGSVSATGFRTWTARPGRHDFVATVRAGARTATAGKSVFVGAGPARAFGRPGGDVAAAGTATPMRPMPAPVLGGSVFDSRTGPAATAGGTKGGGFKPALPGGGPRAGISSTNAPDLSIANADLRLIPANAAAGSNATLTVQVRNLGGASATDGQVLFVLGTERGEVARQQFPAPVAGGGMLALTWPIQVPAGTLSVSVTASASGDANPNNNVARLAPGAASGASRLPGRTLAPSTKK